MVFFFCTIPNQRLSLCVYAGPLCASPDRYDGHIVLWCLHTPCAAGVISVLSNENPRRHFWWRDRINCYLLRYSLSEHSHLLLSIILQWNVLGCVCTEYANIGVWMHSSSLYNDLTSRILIFWHAMLLARGTSLASAQLLSPLSE